MISKKTERAYYTFINLIGVSGSSFFHISINSVRFTKFHPSASLLDDSSFKNFSRSMIIKFISYIGGKHNLLGGGGAELQSNY